MRHITPVVLSLIAACSAEPSFSEGEHGITSSNKIGLNKIALNKIALNKIALNKIALNKIALNKIALNSISTSELLSSPDGREVLDYLISCAFPEGTTLVGTAEDGTTYEFDGSIGLAPKWATRRLNLEEQRWISACMLARVNNAGHELLISLRGPHDALDVTTEEADEFVLQEGAFYGDIFADEQRFYACRGADLYAGDFSDRTLLRACAQPSESGGQTLCGMTYAGECGPFEAEQACADLRGDFYERCHTSPSENGRWHDQGIANRFEEVVTVYVREFE